LAGGAMVSSLAGYDDGEWWVQDAAAALPVRLLRPQAGERILDVCAAPGGKTMQLAQAGAHVTALDISPRRMQRVRRNLQRTDLNGEVVVVDALKYRGEAFDAVLLDAPCSGTGTIRRHPDLPYAKDSGGFAALFGLQQAMLDHALSLLKPGGRLVYCTCSLLFDEGEEQIKDLMARAPGCIVVPDALRVAGIDAGWIGEFGLRTRPDFWPELGGMDGFFMTVLQKPA
ncbi:MAG: RsmB/NOP family class I SAM-dependent RNA methyltransferase, partial [Paracoccaceae bacterium]